MTAKKEPIRVLKASGEREAYDENKVRRSMVRAGITPDVQDRLLAKINASLYDGISTREIYDQIVAYLDQNYPQGRGRYSLKQALMNLGPSGYPFESFLAAVLEKRGFAVEVGRLVQGKCTEHEADILLEKDGRRVLVECKFHNQPGHKTDIKIALYVKERFDDLVAGFQLGVPGSLRLDEVWLATNTKFTRRCEEYGMCSGMKLLSWNYPPGESLRELIEQLHLHPVTCLSSVSKNETTRLLEEGIILCRDVIEAPEGALKQAGLTSGQVRKIKEEAGWVVADAA